MYSIGFISNNWIHINYDFSSYDIQPLIQLLKSIQVEIGGDIIRENPDDDIFSLTNDKYKLKFQWDSCFGCNIVLNNKNDETEVLKLLQNHFNKLT